MKRPTELINEISTFDEGMYGYEMGRENCKELSKYIFALEKALDKACEMLTQSYWGKGPHKWSKEEWKEWLMEDE